MEVDLVKATELFEQIITNLKEAKATETDKLWVSVNEVLFQKLLPVVLSRRYHMKNVEFTSFITLYLWQCINSKDLSLMRDIMFALLEENENNQRNEHCQLVEFFV
jgi:hypothetical protein